jgi:hypothetical protein
MSENIVALHIFKQQMVVFYPLLYLVIYPFSFKDVLVSSKLSMNLAFVSQLVDQNYDVHTLLMMVVLCKIRCQGSWYIAKEPKHGCLFYLQRPIPRSLPSFPVLSLLCHKSRVSNEVWHKRIDHPYFRVLSYLLKSGLLNNKEHSSSTMFFDCATCKLEKSKTFTLFFWNK